MIGSVVVKGLARSGDCLRHGGAKCVDASLFESEERLLPSDTRILADRCFLVDENYVASS